MALTLNYTTRMMCSHTHKALRSLQRYPAHRLLSYVPLFDGVNYASGLTIYCSWTSLNGFIVEGLTNKVFVGQRRGYPVYLPLQPGERILSAWVRSPDPNESHIASLRLGGPQLLVSSFTLWHRSWL